LKQAIVVNFDDLHKLEYGHHFEDVDVAFNTFGTTRSDAGGAEAFRRIDYGYAVKFGQVCADHGIKHMHLVTSQGADPSSFFLYMEVKGKIEEYYKNLKFDDLSIYRPGFLDREKKRFGEKLASIFVSGISVDTIGKAMVTRAIQLADRPVATKPDVQYFDNKRILGIDAAAGAPNSNL
jgi:oxidoreductase